MHMEYLRIFLVYMLEIRPLKTIRVIIEDRNGDLS
jgi:hypothetical protein